MIDNHRPATVHEIARFMVLSGQVQELTDAIESALAAREAEVARRAEVASRAGKVADGN